MLRERMTANFADWFHDGTTTPMWDPKQMPKRAEWDQQFKSKLQVRSRSGPGPVRLATAVRAKWDLSLAAALAALTACTRRDAVGLAALTVARCRDN
jgi:hypothetical protein